MDEIRFNIAATGYLSDKIWEYIKIAKEIFPYVSIEIPSIARDYKILKQALVNLEKFEIDYLNLHDYVLVETDSNSSNEASKSFLLNKVSHLNYAPSSIRNTEKIIALTKKNNYHFHINHCSMQQKEIQMLNRRLKMGNIFNDPVYDTMMKDGTVCNFYCFPKDFHENNLEDKLLDPDFCSSCRPYLITKKSIKDSLYADNKLIRISYVPQMELNRKKILLEVKEIRNSEFII